MFKVNKVINNKMKIINYKDEDYLEKIEKLLYEEYIINGMNRGFWCNIEIIRGSLKQLKIIKKGGRFIGFCLMEKDKVTPSILWLKVENRNQGIGKKLVKKIEKQAQKKGKQYMAVFVTDESSCFWEKLGYVLEISTGMMKKVI